VNPRVLVADDQLFVRAWIREILEPEGMEVVAEAVDPDSAVAAFERTRPDVAAIDVMMPPGSSVEAVRAIRRLDPRVRIVALCARGQETLAMEAVSAGACDYLVKPLRQADVMETLRAALQEEE